MSTSWPCAAGKYRKRMFDITQSMSCSNRHRIGAVVRPLHHVMNSKNNTTRKSRVARWLSFLLIPLFSGCYSVDSHGRKFAVRDPLPQDSAKGFADFSLSLDSGLRHTSVRWLGDDSIGGADTVHLGSRGSSLLRIAAPPGEQTFIVAHHTVITVPITAGMTTPVELKTVRTGNTIWANENYQITTRISPPVPHAPLP